NHRPVGESQSSLRLDLDKNFKVTGPLGLLPAVSFVNFLTRQTGHIQTTDFDYLPIPFACVATDLGTGEVVVLREGNLASAIRASSSIPGILEPWPLDGRLLVDGGLVANLPVGIAKEIFPGYPVIAVNLSGPDMSKPKESFSGLIDVMMQTIDIMTLENIRRNEGLADIVLHPETGTFGMLNTSGYDTVYARGLSVAEENLDRIIAISESAPPARAEFDPPPDGRIVRGIRVEGLHGRAARDIEASFRNLVDAPYDVDAINKALVRISRRDEIATVDVNTPPLDESKPEDVEIVFSVEKRPPYELTADGYTTNLHQQRWLGVQLDGRDLFSEGDAANFDARYGKDEWGLNTRYFTPLQGGEQWGFALGTRKESYEPEGFADASFKRYYARAVFYMESDNSRFGLGAAMEYTDANEGGHEYGPYLYYTIDTLDNQLVPTRGYTFNTQVWWNTANILTSRTNLTAYIPFALNKKMHNALDLGLETGDAEHEAYRALLGDQEELMSLSRNPLAGDQAAWARLGIGKNFLSSWWGTVRGEIFAGYGVIMDDWSRRDEAWETGIAISVPGEFLNGKLLLIYDNHGELSFGYTLGIQNNWWNYQMP
ncbi:MAG: patatin-like phospholipase family protein, partial [Synergistaceae bacterium]|nr:patatin-like phospholipase family protein [Synergistaceae bacterium]